MDRIAVNPPIFRQLKRTVNDKEKEEERKKEKI